MGENKDLAEKIYWILIEEGQHNLKFPLGNIITNTPDEVRDIVRKHIKELTQNNPWKVGEMGMKIVKEGETVWFDCRSCGCLFRVGIHSVESPDGGENYYAKCPTCGSECHADAIARDSNKRINEHSNDTLPHW